ncbi:hypothetical protein [Clostridium cellulovorans]|uniref:DUF4830 domain-containing protein n=1 Tax=Clostridium cellulovorans (strain ATCC 35296 / DSM 3052 / OCM 3 / 743B) TaxID=573061 RepID=D9STV8_CLOC7|nr:hypothetical protein [Clostridium cellulovorans]ADL50796.1 hypothetical protein Clocel_1034 [Clostridium cellulovorans 743B]
MRKLLLVLIGVMLSCLIGGTGKAVGDEKIAEDFVKAQGYDIITPKGEINKYVLEKSKLHGGTETIPYQQSWGVQTVGPDSYFGKEIIIYGFIVKNHPLEKKDKNVQNGVAVNIMLSDSKVIGGYSYPNEDIVGAYSSLDGKTLEEVTGLSFQQWQDNWNKKYRN